jgi:hypothetical protein
MSERDKSFTVSDRRHFTAEGCPRSDEAGEPVSVPHGEEPPPGGAPPPAGPADFSGFLLTLAAQAGMLLAQKPAEGAESGRGALEEARSVISILEMLKDKTEGRRSEPEDALLDHLLFQLRLAYVEKARTGGA